LFRQPGLAHAAQRTAVTDFLNGGRWSLIAEYVEIESGANGERPKLAEALARCRLHNATLVIAKIDRLSRDAVFLLGLQKAGVRFVAADRADGGNAQIPVIARPGGYWVKLTFGSTSSFGSIALNK
jgi:DNA invertase Pin-like site-specific DNA recombinase